MVIINPKVSGQIIMNHDVQHCSMPIHYTSPVVVSSFFGNPCSSLHIVIHTTLIMLSCELLRSNYACSLHWNAPKTWLNPWYPKLRQSWCQSLVTYMFCCMWHPLDSNPAHPINSCYASDVNRCLVHIGTSASFICHCHSCSFQAINSFVGSRLYFQWGHWCSLWRGLGRVTSKMKCEQDAGNIKQRKIIGIYVNKINHVPLDRKRTTLCAFIAKCQ